MGHVSREQRRTENEQIAFKGQLKNIHHKIEISNRILLLGMMLEKEIFLGTEIYIIFVSYKWVTK